MKLKSKEKSETSVERNILRHRERCARGQSYADTYERMLQIIALSIVGTVTCMIQ